ncbi:bacteriocin [Pseudoalteromonas sp. DL2-H2.2]|nr:bacteriocin [Pseudoalteromonas sp. DL2-H2.2]MCF2911217.1 bacteriocin [Pseudoalteromonas sp. DL2-H2.2]
MKELSVKNLNEVNGGQGEVYFEVNQDGFKAGVKFRF